MKPAALAALALLAGCLADGGDSPATDAGAEAAWSASQPVLLTSPGGGAGFEPSIDVGPDGTVYVAAAKAARLAAVSSGQLADWAWWSADGGATWRDLESPMGAHRAFAALEGDTAVDAFGRLYYADTYGPDYHLHRWSPGPAGPAWDWSRPLPTAAPLDDRPWLAAHGDGVLYLLSNVAAPLPSPGRLGAAFVEPASIWVFASEDGGLTWSAGTGVSPAGFCEVAASPADDRTAWVACAEGEGAGAPMRVRESRNRGADWESVFAAEHRLGTGYLSPVPFADRAGVPGAAWLDERVDWSGLQTVEWAGDVPGQVWIARPGPAGWQAFEVTPFEGRFGMLHACAGSAGLAAIVFYGTEDLTPGNETPWFAYALVLPALGDGPGPAHLVRLLDEPAAVEAVPPRDLFECAVGPDDAVHVAVQQNRYDEEGEFADGIRADVLHVRVARGGG